MKIIVIGLGNPVLTDDAVGIRISELLENNLPQITFPENTEVHITQNESGGWDILDLAVGFDVMILIDALLDKSLKPGEMRWYSDKVFTSIRLSGVHSMDVFSAVEYGKSLKLKVPEQILVLGVGVMDILTFSEKCTPAIEAVIETGKNEIIEKIQSIITTPQRGMYA
jgi:hydrogenase maturation protease